MMAKVLIFSVDEVSMALVAPVVLAKLSSLPAYNIKTWPEMFNFQCYSVFGRYFQSTLLVSQPYATIYLTFEIFTLQNNELHV